MPDSEPDDDSAADLRARVSDLEATVDDQAETIQKLMPSRRQTIAGLGLLGAGAGVGRLSTERARAQAAGNQGTEEEPNNIWAWDLDVQNGATFNGNPLTGVGQFQAAEGSIDEDAQKKFIGSASQSGGTIDLSFSRPVAKAELRFEGVTATSGSHDALLQINGVDSDDSPDYRERLSDGTTSSGNDYWTVGPITGGLELLGAVRIETGDETTSRCAISGPAQSEVGEEPRVVHGHVRAGSGDFGTLESVTLLIDDTESIDTGTIRAYELAEGG